MVQLIDISVSLEVGIQNSGLGLVLIFGFFGGLGGMAVIAAWWGIWHILAGLSLAALCGSIHGSFDGRIHTRLTNVLPC